MSYELILRRALLPYVFFCPTLCLGATWYVAPAGMGNGDEGDPFGSIQQAIEAAMPGDVIEVAGGNYTESLSTVRDGSMGARIEIRGSGHDVTIVTFDGRVLNVAHAYHTVSGLKLDGQYGDQDLLRIRDGADGLVLSDSEVLRTTRDCIDMSAPDDVLIQNVEIHRCLNAAGGGTDAHGITGGAVRRLTIRGVNIHSFSGDAIQFDPGRDAPGWDDIQVADSRLWLAPLEQPENGFAAGTVTGENAIDTKTWEGTLRGRMTIRNTVAYGFRNGRISNMAAFNIKEKVDAQFDGVTVYDSEIAFRVRGPTSRPGAWVTVQNAVIYDVDKAIRYEDDIEVLNIYNTTVGNEVTQVFQAASAGNSVLDVRNTLVFGQSLPGEAVHPSNLAVDSTVFVDAGAANYRLQSGTTPVDAGDTIATVTQDRDGVLRPAGNAYDVGAYEFCVDCPIFSDGFEIQ